MTVSNNNAMSTWDVRRVIRLAGALTPEDVADIRQALEALPGMSSSLQVEAGSTQITVVYDASRLDYTVVVTALEEAGFAVAKDWWNGLKARVYQFSDANARDNAKAPSPACCNKPPK